MSIRRRYRVGELAALAGVSVRTLHHYDHVGLLRPTGRSDAGYRLYTDADLLRLQQIMLARESGLRLAEVARLLDALDDPRALLLAQRARLVARRDATDRMLRSVDAALAALDDPETPMTPHALFDGFDPAQHEAEAEQAWGHTDAWRVAQARTGAYTPDDWARYAAENAAILGEAARAMAAGLPPSGPEGRAVAERHRLLIDRWFYPCSLQMHAGLSDTYTQDPRFAARIDRDGEGLTPWLVAAIRANAARERQGAGPL